MPPFLEFLLSCTSVGCMDHYDGIWYFPVVVPVIPAVILK